MTPARSLPEGLKGLVVAASLVVVVAGLKAGQTLFVPILLALFLTILCLPLLDRLRRRGLPKALAVFVTMLLAAAVLAVVGWVLSLSLDRVTEKAPRYQVRFQNLITSLVEWLEEHGFRIADWVSPESIGPGPLVDLLRSTFIGVATLVTGLVLVLLLMGFMLFEAAGLRAKLGAALERQEVTRYAKITGEVQRYLVIKTLISLATGICVGVWVWLVGLDFPLLWGFVAFLANYIPNIGSILAALPAVLLAMVQLSVTRTLLIILGYALVNLFFGNILEPQVMGRRLRLSPLAVFLSLVFWGWVWGAAGMLLAVPITMVLKILLENTASLAWMGRLLDPPPR